MRFDDYKSAVQDTLPVLAGYLFIGMGFGMIMNASGYGIAFPLAMSAFIFAGSMQYAAIGLFADGAGILTVALTTLIVNARHIFYGLSMIDRYKDAGKRKPYMIFALTDETYSIVCSTEKGNDYCFLVSLINHIYWMAGTLIGALLGNIVHFNTEGMDFALTALFITIVTDQWLKSSDHVPALIGIISSVLCLLVFGPDRFLIPSMILILAALLLRRRKEGKND